MTLRGKRSATWEHLQASAVLNSGGEPSGGLRMLVAPVGLVNRPVSAFDLSP